MKINSMAGQNSTNFGAQVRLNAPYKDMLMYAPIKTIHEQLKKSGSSNVYELGKTSYNQVSKAGKSELLLNGEKFGEQAFSPSEGMFGFVQNFLKQCLEKETALMADAPAVSEKLEKVREFIGGLGLSVENVKKWL